MKVRHVNRTRWNTSLLFNFRLFQLMFCKRMKCLIRRLKTHSGE